MKVTRWFRVLVLIVGWGTAPAALHAQEFQPRVNFGMPLEPQSGVLHGVGQTQFYSHINLRARLPEDKRPIFHMVYCGLDKTPGKIRRRFARWRHELNQLPGDVGLNFGLTFANKKGGKTDKAQKVLDGDYDENLLLIAQGLASLNRPILLRIGFECNGFWNDYKANTYVPAFQYIAKVMRMRGGKHIAIVWCTHPADPLKTMMQYYPGDEWVDWWSIDLFQTKFLSKPVVRDFCQAAADHKRPVLIGESTPAEVRGTGEKKWNAWFKPFFELIRTEPSIKGFSYIHRDWDTTDLKWGDTRIAPDPILLKHYVEEVSQPWYVHSRETLPVRWHFPILQIEAPTDENQRFCLTAGKPAAIRLDQTELPDRIRYAELVLRVRVTAADGTPLAKGKAKLQLLQNDAVLDETSLDVEFPSDLASLSNSSLFVKPENSLQLLLVGKPGTVCHIDGPDTSQGEPAHAVVGGER